MRASNFSAADTSVVVLVAGAAAAGWVAALAWAGEAEGVDAGAAVVEAAALVSVVVLSVMMFHSSIQLSPF
jgi:hypothetical protein